MIHDIVNMGQTPGILMSIMTRIDENWGCSPTEFEVFVFDPYPN